MHELDKSRLLLSCVTNKLKQLGVASIGCHYHHCHVYDYSSHHSLNKQAVTLRINNSTSIVALAQADTVLPLMMLSLPVLTKSKIFEPHT